MEVIHFCATLFLLYHNLSEKFSVVLKKKRKENKRTIVTNHHKVPIVERVRDKAHM